jgi:type II secretory pathway component PulF
MPTYQYEGLTAQGRLIKGTLQEQSLESAREQLQQMGLSPRLLEPAAPSPAGRIGRGDYMLFNQQLASLAKAGVPMEQGLRQLAADVGSRRLKAAIERVADELEAGANIDEAFGRHAKDFPPLYGQILRAGVRTGRLSEMLVSLGRHMDVQRQTRRIIVESMMYPCIVLALATLVLTGVLVFVVPDVTAILNELRETRVIGRTLAAHEAMRMLSVASRHIGAIWLTLAALVAASGAALWLMGRYDGGRRRRERMLLRLPLLGRIYRNSILSHLADAMSLLALSGADIPEMLRVGAKVCGSPLAQFECEQVAQLVERGEDIGKMQPATSLVPGLLLLSMHTAAARGELPDGLADMSEMYGQAARNAQGTLQATLLPAMLVFIGVVLCLAAVAAVYPIVSVLKEMNSF